MKKKLLAILLAAVAAVSVAAFAACDNGGNDSSSSSSSSSAEQSETEDSTAEGGSSDSEEENSDPSGSVDDIQVAVDYKILLNSDNAFVFEATQDVLTLNDTTSVYDYISALQTAGKISFDGYTGQYGYYITSLNSISEQSEYNADYTSGSGFSWMVYTNLYELDSVTYATADYGTYEYSSVTLGQASYGVSYLPCVEGYYYAFVYEAWSY